MYTPPNQRNKKYQQGGMPQQAPDEQQIVQSILQAISQLSPEGMQAIMQALSEMSQQGTASPEEAEYIPPQQRMGGSIRKW